MIYTNSVLDLPGKGSILWYDINVDVISVGSELRDNLGNTYKVVANGVTTSDKGDLLGSIQLDETLRGDDLHIN